MADGACNGFEPQSYLRDRCKKCFRVSSAHDAQGGLSLESKLPIPHPSKSFRPTVINSPKTTLSVVVATPAKNLATNSNGAIASSASGVTENRAVCTTIMGASTIKDIKDQRRRSLNETVVGGSRSSSKTVDKLGVGDDCTDSISLASSYKTANSKSVRAPSDQIHGARSEESISSNMDSHSMVTAMSGSFMDFNASGLDSQSTDDEDRAMTPTEASEFFVDKDMQRRCWRENAKLRTENEALRNDISDLRQEMDEMHDTYREEEIEEFRDLQRELEQNAKNCRILQFKLRKSERQRDQLQTEKNLIGCKLKELQNASRALPNDLKSDHTAGSSILSSDSRVGELEAELRIAKEVSVRLHSELELAEDKRYKLEDEIFYFKEKVRELQTQNKWREAKSKAEQRRQGEETPSTEAKHSPAPLLPLSTEELGKELRDVVERENDLKDQLRFTEESLRRTQSRLRDVENENEELMLKLNDVNNNNLGGISSSRWRISKDVLKGLKPPMLRSYSEGNSHAQALLKSGEAGRKSSLLIEKNCDLVSDTGEAREDDHANQNGFHTPQDSRQRIAFLEKRCEDLERELEVQRSHAKEGSLISEMSSIGKREDTGVTSDEVEEFCLLLASVETQTARISKQLDKLEIGQKDERRRSLSSRDSLTALIAVDLANVMNELKTLRSSLESSRPDLNRFPLAPSAEAKCPPQQNGTGAECAECKELTSKLEAQRDENAFYRKKNKELTNQVLETEDRWASEIERQNGENRRQRDALVSELTKTKEELKSTADTANERLLIIGGKNDRLEEVEKRMQLLNVELASKVKMIREMEAEQKTMREWEIKYRKLESLYDKEKEKYNVDSARAKTEATILKKKTEEAVAELNNLHQRREIMWNEERAKLETELASLKKSDQQVNGGGGHAAAASGALSQALPIRTINYRVTRMSNEPSGIPELKQKIAGLEKRNAQLEDEVLALRMCNTNREAEYTKSQQAWQHDKDNLTHKSRQEEKVRNAEIESLQQKLDSRMKVMENTNKSLHAQLVQVRRERDFHKETILCLEQKLLASKEEVEAERAKCSQLATGLKELDGKLTNLQSTYQNLSSELALTRETHQADKDLWAVERTCLASASTNVDPNNENERERKITENALSAAENVQRKYAEYQKFYTKEVQRLNSRMKEMGSKELRFRERAKELTERIRILEIEQRNLVQAREKQISSKEVMQAEHERMLRLAQQLEVQKLTRRYKVNVLIDQVKAMLLDKTKTQCKSARDRCQFEASLRALIGQLCTLRDEDEGRVAEAHSISAMNPHPTTTDALSRSSISLRSNPVPCTRGGLPICYAPLSQINRSYSTESSTTWDSRLLDCTARSVSPTKRPKGCCDPVFGCSLADYDGVEFPGPKALARSASYDRYGDFHGNGNTDRARDGGVFSANGLRGAGTLTDVGSRSFYEPTEQMSERSVGGYRRMNSAGTNILYRIRREELSKGQPPSVKAMAKAFESMAKEKPSAEFKSNVWNRAGALFSMRKSRSVDQESNVAETGVTGSRHINAMEDAIGASIPPRGGRNPFKGMGTKLVEKVRRSISRSMSRGRKTCTEENCQEKTGDITDAPGMIPFIEDDDVSRQSRG